MIAAQYFLDFILFSFMGWIYECTYCMVKSGHWENRGFLFGPICPIYGVGAVTAITVFNRIGSFAGQDTPLWQIFLICMAGSAVLEFTTSWVMERLFHAVWWDYSDVPLNVQGRICLPASIGFGVAGIVVVKLLTPVAMTIRGSQHPLLAEVLAMGLIAYMGADLALTAAALTNLVARMEAIEAEFNDRAENAYQMVKETPQALAERAGSAYQKVKETPQAIAERAETAYQKVKETPQALAERAETAYQKVKETPQALAERAKSYEQVMRERTVDVAGSLNARQKHVLMSVSHFTNEKTTTMSRRIKESMQSLHSRTIGRKGDNR